MITLSKVQIEERILDLNEMISRSDNEQELLNLCLELDFYEGL